MSHPYRFALIGCGFFAQNHLQAWAEMSDVELVATCDINPDSAAAAAEKFGGTPYTDAAELFAKEEFDFVDIATTPPTHRMMVELAAQQSASRVRAELSASLEEERHARLAAEAAAKEAAEARALDLARLH
ncbi:MAG: Gfo/Idh/MocA family oxidoreductase, partial [Actinomycetota bacterium]|nr:Gfo/Idh/MocA family oxidoreductase [Actinomycetota bacterium]